MTKQEIQEIETRVKQYGGELVHAYIATDIDVELGRSKTSPQCNFGDLLVGIDYGDGGLWLHSWGNRWNRDGGPWMSYSDGKWLRA